MEPETLSDLQNDLACFFDTCNKGKLKSDRVSGGSQKDTCMRRNGFNPLAAAKEGDNNGRV